MGVGEFLGVAARDLEVARAICEIFGRSSELSFKKREYSLGQNRIAWPFLRAADMANAQKDYVRQCSLILWQGEYMSGGQGIETLGLRGRMRGWHCY